MGDHNSQSTNAITVAMREEERKRDATSVGRKQHFKFSSAPLKYRLEAQPAFSNKILPHVASSQSSGWNFFLTTVLFRFSGGHYDKCRAAMSSLLTPVPVCVNEVPRVEVRSGAQCLCAPCINRNRKRLCAISLSEAEWI